MNDTLLCSLPTPCFVIDEVDLEKSLTGFSVALAERFPRSVPSLSVKTNSLPYLLVKARQTGYFAEVVSADEYELALGCGFPKNRIVYNGPMKSRETFLDAIEHGALVNIETFREIRWLSELDTQKSYTVGLRMNVNISEISPDDQNHEDDNSRFGFSPASGDFDRALQQISELPHVTMTRLHIHRTSRTRSLRFYQRLIEYALSELQKRDIRVEHLDIGGGYYGMMPGKPSYRDYCDVFARTIGRFYPLEALTVIIEPGNAVVASSFSFVSEVIDVKHHDGAHYVTIDGSRIDVDPLFHKRDYFHRIIRQSEDMPLSGLQIVGGCTCLEFDRLMELADTPLLREGDRFVLDRVGAYTLTLTPQFIRYWPAVYVVREDSSPVKVRNKFTAKSLNSDEL